MCRSAILCKACVKGEQGRSPTTTTLWPAQSASSGIFATAEPTGNRNQDQRGANGTGARAVWLRIRCADGNNQMAIWGRRCRSLRCYEARRTTAATLARSLSALPPDERGWITFTEARILFSSKGGVWRNGRRRQKKHRVVRGAAPVRYQLYADRRAGLFRTRSNRCDEH